MGLQKFDVEGTGLGKCSAHEEIIKQVITNANNLEHGIEEFKTIKLTLGDHGRCLTKIDSSMSRVEGYMNGKAQTRKSVIAWTGIILTVAIIMVTAAITISKTLGKMEHVLKIQNEALKILEQKDI